MKKQEKFKPVTVLLYGLSIGCLFWGMTIILIEYFDRSVISIVGWQIISCALFFYYFAVLVGKTQDETVLSGIETMALLVNILMCVYALGMVLINFWDRSFAGGNLYVFGIVLGLPNLIAFIYWNILNERRNLDRLGVGK